MWRTLLNVRSPAQQARATATTVSACSWSLQGAVTVARENPRAPVPIFRTAAEASGGLRAAVEAEAAVVGDPTVRRWQGEYLAHRPPPPCCLFIPHRVSRVTQLRERGGSFAGAEQSVMRPSSVAAHA